MPARQGTRFLLTCNGVTEDVAHALPAHPDERYAAWQLEQGANGGNIHVQAYVELTTRRTANAVVTVFIDAGWPHPHVEFARGSAEQCRDYCTKDDTRVAGPWERGVFGRGGQGKRNDLADAVDTLKTDGIRAVAEQHPTAFVKFHRGLRELSRELEVKPRDEEFEPRPWQHDVIDYIHSEPDDRHIIWVTDGVGNKGKTRLARHLVLEHGATILEGRVQDMAYMYNKEKIVVIDVARAQLENTKHLYAFAEKLKGGMVVSTKYESHTKIFNPPHVIFFSNQTWDRELWSHDRVIEINLAIDYP